MKINILTLLGVLLLLGGCSSKTDEVYQNSIQKGLDAVAEDNFNKAEGLFEIALDTKKDDPQAKAYVTQVKLILEANNLVKDNKIEDAIQSLNKSIKVKQGSKVISSVSKDKVEELTVQQQNQTKFNSLLSDAKNLNKSRDFQKSNQTLVVLFNEDLTQFITIKEEAGKFKSFQ